MSLLQGAVHGGRHRSSRARSWFNHLRDVRRALWAGGLLMVTSHSNDGAIHLSLDTPARHDPLDGFPEPPPWIADAVCATTDPEAFYPEKGGSTREAKAICRSCTVQAECLDWALDRDERFGIWGGLSERERRRLKGHHRCRDCGGARPKNATYCDDCADTRRQARLAAIPRSAPPVGQYGAIRVWARDNGHPVRDRGPIPPAVLELYNAQHDPAQPAIHNQQEPA
jgi:WhiB family redox-sensing transcriptional regulator